MSKLKEPHLKIGSRMLAALPKAEYKRLLPFLEEVPLELRTYLYKINHPIKYVWFPKDGIISLLAQAERNTSIEVATVGNEGIIGLPLFLGSNTDTIQAYVQVAGMSMRMDANAFKKLVNGGGPLYSLIQRYAHVLMNQMAQSAACNHSHTIEERCARWLLMTHDRIMSDTFDLKQEFLAQMLGVRRATVSKVASRLQKNKLIRYTRGRMVIVDRTGLEKISCRCYQLIKDEYDKLLG